MLVGALAVALGFGLWRALTDGRFRGTHAIRDEHHRVVEPGGRPRPTVSKPPQPTGEPTPEPASLLAGTPWADQLGDRATLLQFSSAFCAPCRTTRHLLHDVAERTPGVTHVEVDAEHNLDLVRRLGVMRTPTTLVLDPAGRELVRATGAPRREQVEAALLGHGVG